jgi:hypothetical protein
MERPMTSREIVKDLKTKIADALELINGYEKKIADIEAALAKSRECETGRETGSHLKFARL